VAVCGALGVVRPNGAWGLGLLVGVAAAIADLTLAHGRSTPLHFSIFGSFGSVWPALTGTFAGQFIAALTGRVRARGVTG